MTTFMAARFRGYQGLLQVRASEEQENLLIREVAEVEIRETLRSMHDDRAHRPDGYSIHFFKAS